jgi:hypothetical protein
MKDLTLFFLITFVTIPVKTDDPLCAGYPYDEEILFPSSADCGQYYKCFNGTFTIEECPDGLFFSENNKGCVLPEYAECAGGSGSPTKSTTTDSSIAPTSSTSSSSTRASTVTTTTTPVTETTTTGTTPGNVDPRCIDGDVSYWPHPQYCNRYIECYQGNSYEMSCPTNLYYSEKQKKCTNANQSECCKQNQSQCK